MAYLIAVVVPFLLLVLFALLSWLETSQGFRLFGNSRRRLDLRVSRISYVATHIDWASFLRHLARTSAERVAHDIVHTVLLMVRATERFLTRTIRVLRERVAKNTEPGRKVPDSLVSTIIRFRKNLRKETAEEK